MPGCNTARLDTQGLSLGSPSRGGLRLVGLALICFVFCILFYLSIYCLYVSSCFVYFLYVRARVQTARPWTVSPTPPFECGRPSFGIPKYIYIYIYIYVYTCAYLCIYVPACPLPRRSVGSGILGLGLKARPHSRNPLCYKKKHILK